MGLMRIRLLVQTTLGILVTGVLAVYIAVSENTSADTPVSQIKQNLPARSIQNPKSKIQNRLTPGHKRMLTLLKEIADRTPETNDYIGSGMVRRLREQLAALPTNAPDLIRWHLHMEIAKGELRLGNEAEAIAQFTQARRLLPQLRGQLSPLKANQTLFRLGVAHLRQGETQNCCLRHTPESCILPLQGNAIHTEQDGSRKAITYFIEVLRNTTAQTPLHLEATWLLNIAYMTVGGYPAQVPKPHLIPPEAFQSEEKIPRFQNIAPHLGLDTFDMSGGAIAEDFDNDGYLDLVVSTWDVVGQIRFFRNNQDGTFSERTTQAGLLGLYGGLNLLQADYNNDENIDVLVLRGAWLEKNGKHPNSLLRNNGDSTFTDVTFDAGLGEVHYPTQTASWGDYDNDGNLDLYIGNETTEALKAPCQLFHNNGDGTFTDVAAGAGVQNYGFTKAVIWGDYDGDRWSDLYVSNFKGVNRLYHNDGDGTFTNVAEKLNIASPIRSFPSWFWDFNNDGNLDLYVSAYSAGVSHLAANALGVSVQFPTAPQSSPPRLGAGDRGQGTEPAPTTAFFNESNLEGESAHLYRGDGDGGFYEVAVQHNLVDPNAPMGSNFGDLDNDGYLDFYLGTGYPDYKNIMPNVMYRNKGGKGFVDVTYAGGFGHLQKGHSVVFADFDNDGDQDIFEQMGGAFPGDKYNNALFENPGFGNHWITVKLVGVDSNRSAIGARIHLKITEDGAQRSIYKHINSGGSFGANPLRQTIGLGEAEKIETLEVFWPTTGLTQIFRDVSLDGFIRIVEGEEQYTTLGLKKLDFSRQVSVHVSDAGNPQPTPVNVHAVKEKTDRDEGDEMSNSGTGIAAPTPSHQIEAEDKRKSEFTPEFADYYNRGLDLLKTENYVGAAQAFQKAIEIHPGHERAHYILGRIYLINLAKTAEAVEELQTAIELAPDNARAHQMLGVTYFKQNEYQAAIPPLRRAIELGAKVEEDYPYHPYYDLGMVYLRQNRFDDAIRYFEQAIQLHPDQIRTYYSLGNAYIRTGDVKKGAEHIRKYQALKPYLNAASQLEIAVRRTPKSPERWHQLGRLHAQYGRFDKALKPLEKSIELNPNNWEVYNILGLCYMRLNQLDKMEKVCEASVRLAPNEANAHNALGLSYFLQGKYLKAKNSFVTTIQLDAENPEFHESLGKAYERLGEAEKAAQELETARQLRAKHGKKEE